MGFLKRHPAIALGLTITVLFLVLNFIRVGFLDSLELKFYDVMMSLRGDAQSPSDVVIVDIDNDSIEKLGRWPWPRFLLAKGIGKIGAGKPRVIGLSFILSESEESAGLMVLKNLEDLFAETVLDQAGDPGRAFLDSLQEARVKMDNDKKLAESIQSAGKVVLPVFFKESVAAAETPTETDKRLVEQSIQTVSNPDGLSVPRGDDITLPIETFVDAPKGIGHINLAYDLDGTARRERQAARSWRPAPGNARSRLRWGSRSNTPRSGCDRAPSQRARSE